MENLAELATQLNADNFEHLGASIECKVHDRVKFLKRIGDPKDKALHIATKRFKWVAKECSMLRTDNVAHTKSKIVRCSKHTANYIRSYIDD